MEYPLPSTNIGIAGYEDLEGITDYAIGEVDIPISAGMFPVSFSSVIKSVFFQPDLFLPLWWFQISRSSLKPSPLKQLTMFRPPLRQLEQCLYWVPESASFSYLSLMEAHNEVIMVCLQMDTSSRFSTLKAITCMQVLHYSRETPKKNSRSLVHLCSWAANQFRITRGHDGWSNSKDHWRCRIGWRHVVNGCSSEKRENIVIFL